MDTNKTCPLCQVSAKLMESHIFPRCFTKLVREKAVDSRFNNRFYEIHKEASNLVQDSPTEYLLCDSCEQKISRNEKYFKEAVHLRRHHTQSIHGQQVWLLRGLDYTKARLFLLSVIYRMSVSSVRQFESVSLGDHEDVLRNMIVAEEPGTSDQYPITAMIPLIGGRMEEGVLCILPVSHINDVTIYHVILGGILYSFSIPRLSDQGDAALNAYLNGKWVLNESGDWFMPLLDFLDIPPVKSLLERRISNRGSIERRSMNTFAKPEDSPTRFTDTTR